uniref:all-trans-retinol 13,14-reductase n=1 Tax=Ciona intestinalis TaxID=7719 RepID=UPI0002B8E871|nr:all-trans-retinol 13,14-reductase [Ciona intestinalis]|eukprot:XP_002122272.2 all-trans-retinol 13,14-reductase [Ciona intestinalis]
MVSGVAAICAAIVVYIAVTKLYAYLFKSKSKNPFLEERTCTSHTLITDKQKRKAVLKKAFKHDLVPNNLDAIVIGSGMGGLTCAGFLARSGKKVLVLESHGRIGGCTHTYKSKGCEFDIGIHYVGNMAEGDMGRCMVDLLTDGKLKWVKLDEQYDTVVFAEPGKGIKTVHYKPNKKEMEKLLIKQYPDDENAIREFYKIMTVCQKSASFLIVLKILPKFLVDFFFQLKLHRVFMKSFNYVIETSLKTFLDRLTDNNELKTVLSYCFGDYGVPPGDAPLMMHGMLMNHFSRDGGFYPYGGASEIAFQMVPGIERSGGAVLARAHVNRIIFENDAACGVAVSHLNEEVEIRAPIIISDAGIYNTYQKLLPREIGLKYGFLDKLKSFNVDTGCLQVMISLDGTKEDLNLPAKNYWVFNSVEPERDMKTFLSLSREDAANKPFPLIFVSFPSAKDPSWNSRYPNKSSCVVVTFANLKWFADWEKDSVKKRGNVYENLKKVFVDQVWNQVLHNFPHLEGKVLHMEGGTPLSHQHYIKCMHGEIYGARHDFNKFTTRNIVDMRGETAITGLYMTGQDVFTCGFMGSAFGGLISASKVLDRYLILDLINNVKKHRNKK